jgi:FtsX-like permease family
VSDFELMYERPRVAGLSAARGALQATLSTGSSYDDYRPPSIDVLLRPGRDSLPRATPVLVSESFLEAAHTQVGHVVPLALAGGTQTVRIVGSYRRFPTLDPALPSVVLDLPTYVAAAFARHGVVTQPPEWWLKSARDHELAAQLRAAPFRSLSTISRSERERALLEDPAPLGVIGALTLGFVVATAFALIGYGVSATASARSRGLEFAVLRTLGLRTGQLSGWIGAESALVVGLSVLTGTVLGLVVAWLVLPYVALGPSGEVPVPPVRLTVPWTTMLWLDLAVLGALGAIAAAQVAYVRRLRPAPVLRGGEGTVVR